MNINVLVTVFVVVVKNFLVIMSVGDYFLFVFVISFCVLDLVLLW